MPRKATTGRSTHDSWSGLPATVTRDSALGFERSLRFESGPVVLELVADRTPDGWRFAARVYRDQKPSGEFILKVGRNRLQPGLHHCFAWSSARPPHSIELLSPSLKLEFDTGIW